MKVRKDFLSLGIPDITEEEKRVLMEALDSGWISAGPKVKEFERQFAEYHNVKHAIATSSCTTALFIAAKVLEITKGETLPRFAKEPRPRSSHQFHGRPLPPFAPSLTSPC